MPLHSRAVYSKEVERNLPGSLSILCGLSCSIVLLALSVSSCGRRGEDIESTSTRVSLPSRTSPHAELGEYFNAELASFQSLMPSVAMLSTRNASTPSPTPIRIQADDFTADLPHQGVTPRNIDTLRFDSKGASLTKAAYACFAFQPADGFASKNLILGWEHPPKDYSGLYILAADFKSMRWRVIHPGFCGLVLLPEDGEYIDPVSGQSFFYILMAGDDVVNLDLVQYGTELPDNAVFMLPEQSALDHLPSPRVAVYTTRTPKGIAGLRNLQCSFDGSSSLYEHDSENGSAGIPGGKRGAADGFWSGLGLSLEEEPLSIGLHDELHNSPDGHINAGRRFMHVDMDSSAGAAPPDTGVLFNFRLSVSRHVELGFETGNFELPANFYLDADGGLSQWEHIGLPGLPRIRLVRPVTELNVSPKVIYAGSQVLFDATATFVDPPATLVTCQLDPGDGSGWQDMGPDFKLVHIYEQPEYYKAQVRVVNSYGYERLASESFYVLDPDAADRIYAVPAKTSCLPGEHVRVTVFTDEAVYPFQFMYGVRVTFAQGNEYVPGSFNVGAPGGSMYAIDGVWTQIEPDSFLELGDQFFVPVDIDNGLKAIDFSIAPLYGHDIELATGAMFNFEIEVNQSTSLGFEVFNVIPRTEYMDGGQGRWKWKDATNAGMPGITVLSD